MKMLLESRACGVDKSSNSASSEGLRMLSEDIRTVDKEELKPDQWATAASQARVQDPSSKKIVRKNQMSISPGYYSSVSRRFHLLRTCWMVLALIIISFLSHLGVSTD